MFSKTHNLLTLLVFSAIIFSNCSTNFIRIAHEFDGIVDHSFYTSGYISETNNIVSILQHPQRRIDEYSLLSETGITVIGHIENRSLLMPSRRLIRRTLSLRNQAGNNNRPITFILPPYLQRYVWRGSVHIGASTLAAVISFDVFAADEYGRDQVFVLTEAAIEQTRLEFTDPFEIIQGNRDFSFLAGYAHVSSSTYRIYVVIDNFPGRFDPFRNIFFDPLQKFQFLNIYDEVVAELESGNFIIYNTLPINEKNCIKNAVALLVAFRHSASVLRGVNSWNLPRNYRFIYP